MGSADFKPTHLRHCFGAASAVAIARGYDAIPILFRDHNGTFDHELAFEDVMPWEYGVVASKNKKRDLDILPKEQRSANRAFARERKGGSRGSTALGN